MKRCPDCSGTGQLGEVQGSLIHSAVCVQVCVHVCKLGGRGVDFRFCGRLALCAQYGTMVLCSGKASQAKQGNYEELQLREGRMFLP